MKNCLWGPFADSQNMEGKGVAAQVLLLQYLVMHAAFYVPQ